MALREAHKKLSHKLSLFGRKHEEELAHYNNNITDLQLKPKYNSDRNKS
jgi:hypothetical protein